jgi:hypothetical protein
MIMLQFGYITKLKEKKKEKKRKKKKPTVPNMGDDVTVVK